MGAPTKLDINADTMKAIEQYDSLRSAMKQLKSEQEEVEALIKSKMGSHTELIYEGNRVVRWSNRKRKGAVNMAKLQARFGITQEDLDAARKPDTEYRAFTVSPL